MMLLLFCILMAFVLRLEKYEEDQAKVDEVEQLQEQLQQEGGSIDDSWQFISAVTRIAATMGIEGFTELVDQIAESTGSDKSTLVKELSSGLEHYNEVKETLSTKLGREPSHEEMLQELSEVANDAKSWQEAEDRLALVEKVEELLSKDGVPPEDATQKLIEIIAKANAWDDSEKSDLAMNYESLLQKHDSLSEKSKRVEQALDNAKRQLAGKGKCLEYPSCFVDQNGKIQYIYDVYFNSSEVTLTSVPVVGYETEKSSLPFNKVTTEEPVSINTYLQQTSALHKWSIANECRFFVKIYDQTAANEKDLYKNMKRKIEQRFYTYEPLKTVMR